MYTMIIVTDRISGVMVSVHIWRSSLGQVKPKAMKLVFAASLLRTQH